jgi:hypothetical protein
MPFKFGGVRPTRALQLALSAVVRQSPDGRLSQNINDGLDGASLDGASIGPVVLLGWKLVQPICHGHTDDQHDQAPSQMLLARNFGKTLPVRSCDM